MQSRRSWIEVGMYSAHRSADIQTFTAQEPDMRLADPQRILHADKDSEEATLCPFGAHFSKPAVHVVAPSATSRT